MSKSSCFHCFFLQTYSLPRGTAVCFEKDNTAVVSCIAQQGTSRSATLLAVLEKIFTLANTAGLSLSATYTQWVKNKWAYTLSHIRGPSMECTLKRKCFQGPCSQWCTPQIDLFALKESTQLSTSLRRTHQTLEVHLPFSSTMYSSLPKGNQQATCTPGPSNCSSSFLANNTTVCQSQGMASVPSPSGCPLSDYSHSRPSLDHLTTTCLEFLLAVFSCMLSKEATKDMLATLHPSST